MQNQSGPQSSRLRIASVYSTTKVDKDKPPASVISIKTPGQINNEETSRTLASPNSIIGETKRVLIKRVGDTTIRLTQNAKPQPAKTPYAARNSAKDTLIATLIDKNNHLKRMLLIAQKEAVLIQGRASSLSKLIDSMLLQLPTAISKKVLQPIPPQVSPEHAIRKVSVRKDTEVSIPRTAVLPFWPVDLPILSIDQFRDLEEKLEFKNFYSRCKEFVLSKLKSEQFLKPSMLLRKLLNTIVAPKTLRKYRWSSNNLSRQPSLEKYQHFRKLFQNIANELSFVSFGKNMNLKAVEQFLRSSVDGQPELGAFKANDLVKNIKNGKQSPQTIKTNEEPLPKKLKPNEVEAEHEVEDMDEEKPLFEWVDDGEESNGTVEVLEESELDTLSSRSYYDENSENGKELLGF